MKKVITSKTTLAELGAIICDALSLEGIEAFLSGGAVVSIYTQNQYQSYDLDFITHADRRRISEVMKKLGFSRAKSRMYSHPETEFTVEFPGAALLVGDQPILEFSELVLPEGKLRLLTPTDCVKDRLAAYYQWNDRQALNQAVSVARSQSVQLNDIEAWSTREGMSAKFEDFLEEVRPGRRKR